MQHIDILVKIPSLISPYFPIDQYEKT